MIGQNEYYPQSVPHPGIDLAECLEELGMGPKEFSVRTGKPEKTIIAVLKGDSSITTDMAFQFENTLHIPARYWIQRQRDYDESLARSQYRKAIDKSTDWARKFPLRAMIRLGWLPDSRRIQDKTSDLLSFFGFSNYKAWEAYYLEQSLKVAFRISLLQTMDPYAISAWLWKGEQQSQGMKVAEFSGHAFKMALVKIKGIMAKHPAGFFPLLQKACSEAGVKLVFTPCLPKTPISGSTRWVGDNPLIQLSGRYKRNDIFWFTFFHEAGHVLLHGKREVFLENAAWKGCDQSKEQAADNFAVKWTLSEDEERQITESFPLTQDAIIEFAEHFGTHPAIIVGRLQHRKLVSYAFGRSLIRPVNLVG